MPDTEWEKFTKDPRIKCKYGDKCYQKNPEHHQTYKHPPLTPKAIKDARKIRRYSPFNRKHEDSAAKKLNKKEESRDKQSDNVEDQATSSNINEPTMEEYNVNLPSNIKFHDSSNDTNVFKQLFSVEMPPDFFKFFQCLNKDGKIVELLSSVGLELIGPFDLLLGTMPVVEDSDLYLIHWRFFYDPPEFQAILKKKGSKQFHLGYYRDSPDEKPEFVASNDSEIDYRITPVAENIFGAVYLYLRKERQKSPFISMTCQKIMDIIKKEAEVGDFSLKPYSANDRRVKIVAKTLHGAGIVVPYNKNTQLGYRQLVEKDENIKKIFAQIQEAKTQTEKDTALSELQPVITYANIAVDECDFGTGLEVGIDLFCSGLKELHTSTQSSLTSAYNLLNRDAFGKIITAHLKYRRKGAKLSILDFK